MLKKVLNWSVAAVSIAMVIYHMVYAQTYLQGRSEHMIFHIGLALILIFLIAWQKDPSFWLVKSVCSCGKHRSVDLFGGCHMKGLIYMVCMARLRLTWRSVLFWFCFAWKLQENSSDGCSPSLALLCIAYMFVGPYLPGIMRSPPMKWNTIIEKLTVGFTGAGIFGPILQVSALYMFLFMIFAALMETCGGTNFSTNWANWFQGVLKPDRP